MEEEETSPMIARTDEERKKEEEERKKEEEEEEEEVQSRFSSGIVDRTPEIFGRKRGGRSSDSEARTSSSQERDICPPSREEEEESGGNSSSSDEGARWFQTPRGGSEYNRRRSQSCEAVPVYKQPKAARERRRKALRKKRISLRSFVSSADESSSSSWNESERTKGLDFFMTNRSRSCANLTELRETEKKNKRKKKRKRSKRTADRALLSIKGKEWSIKNLKKPIGKSDGRIALRFMNWKRAYRCGAKLAFWRVRNNIETNEDDSKKWKWCVWNTKTGRLAFGNETIPVLVCQTQLSKVITM